MNREAFESEIVKIYWNVNPVRLLEKDAAANYLSSEMQDNFTLFSLGWQAAIAYERSEKSQAQQTESRYTSAWKHSCAALLTDGVELWVDRCPHCGKPKPLPPAPEGDKHVPSNFENGVPAVTSEVSETLMICSDHGNCDIYDITNSSAITCLNMDRVWVAVDPLPALAVDLLPAPEGGDK